MSEIVIGGDFNIQVNQQFEWEEEEIKKKSKDKVKRRKRVDKLDIEKKMVHFKQIDEKKLGRGIYLCRFYVGVIVIDYVIANHKKI